MNHVRIKSDGTPQNTSITVDGVELENVTDFVIRGTVDSYHVVDVSLRMYIDELDIDGAIEVRRNEREAVRLSDIEAIDRAIQLIGESGVRSLMQRLIELLASEVKRE